MNDLFKPEQPKEHPSFSPLADRMRPTDFSELLGPSELVGPNGILKRILTTSSPPSLILWGPPGTGKTTIARLLAKTSNCHYETLSAVLSGVKEVREVVARAQARKSRGQRTVLFVDEIHRFNKAQQDAFLPHVEDGTIILVGATTENPSFEVISALLSRCRVIRLHPLCMEDLASIALRALTDKERGLGKLEIEISPKALEYLCMSSNGDARTLLNILELAVEHASPGATLEVEQISKALQHKVTAHDKLGDSHYNLISAFHKSLRGSDPDAALHYFCRMIEGGDSPLFILRRMFNFAAEDIGNADPQALQMVSAALSAYQLMGDPEGILPIAQVVLYLATAPKSNAAYCALAAAKEDIAGKELRPVPEHLINAPTKMMKELGFGKSYRYPHDYKYHYVAEEYLPDNLVGRTYYNPSETGFEREISKRLAFWRKLKEKGHDEKA
ncbi:MAG: replication-associated recombination protein A [Planctomycetota bacterium]